MSAEVAVLNLSFLDRIAKTRVTGKSFPYDFETELEVVVVLAKRDGRRFALLPKICSMCYESLTGQSWLRRLSMSTRKRKRHTPEQIVKKLRDADAMLNAGQDLAAVLQTLEVSEATYHRWRQQYGGMKSEEAKRLKDLEEENKRLKEVVAELTLDNRMLKHINSKNY